MRRARVLFGLVTVAALLAWIWTHAQPPARSDTISPNPAIQSEIARVGAARNDVELQAALTKLQALGGPEFGDLIPQLVYYLMHATDTRDAMVPGVIIERLQISPAQLRQALAPYGNTRDAALKRQIDNLIDDSKR